jgi:hypothetical protein
LVSATWALTEASMQSAFLFFGASRQRMRNDLRKT